jgi:hypothetical protein
MRKKTTTDSWERRQDETPQEYFRRLQAARDSYPLPSTIGELFAGNMLKPPYAKHGPAERALQRYHEKAHASVNGQTELSPGVRQALKLSVTWSQLTKRYPWKVMWQRKVNGRIARGEKMCTTLGGAIAFQRSIIDRVPNATVVSRVRAYDVPPKLRGRFPKKGFYWCPYCMKPRKFLIDESGQWFYAQKKVWSHEKGRYVPTERAVALLRCPMCGCTNRDHVWRRSNQPWEKRRIKSGVRRVRKQRRSRGNRRR